MFVSLQIDLKHKFFFFQTNKLKIVSFIYKRLTGELFKFVPLYADLKVYSCTSDP